LNAADSAVGWKVRTAFESAFTSAVDSVCLAVSSAVRSAVESAVMTAVYWSASAHNSMFDAIFYPTVYSSQIDVAVGLAVGSTSMILAARSAGSSAVYPTVVDRAVHSTVASRFGGSQWLGASAWADFFNDAGITSIDRNYLELVESCGYIWTLDGVCFACDRPSRLKLDDRGRLHSETGQSIKYPSGWGLWHWHGVSVPQFIIEQPERITVRSIQKEVNVEVRRVMIERYGQARYLVDSGARLIHADDMGELYSTDIPGDEPLVMVKVMNSTPEPDGSRKPYFLRVHPECRLMLTNGEFGERQPMTARSAVASTFGMTADEYAKHLITET